MQKKYQSIIFERNYIQVYTTTSDDKNYLNQQHKQLNPTTFRGPTPSAARRITHDVNKYISVIIFEGNYIQVYTTTSDDKNYLNQQHKQLNPTTFRGPTPSAARRITPGINKYISVIIFEGNYLQVYTTTSDDKNYLNQQHKQLNPTTFRGPTPSAARRITHGVNKYINP